SKVRQNRGGSSARHGIAPRVAIRCVDGRRRNTCVTANIRVDSCGALYRGEGVEMADVAGTPQVSVPTSETPASRARFITLLGSIRPYQRSWLSRDVIAGVTLAALAIPEVMGYTKIAGTPVITGLYTILIPIVAFALFGSSRHLVVGGDSATAAILFAGIA